MKPFDPQKALGGAPIVQRNGMAARVVGSLDGRVVVDMQVMEHDSTPGENRIVEIRESIESSGRFNPELGETECDLFMVD